MIRLSLAWSIALAATCSAVADPPKDDSPAAAEYRQLVERFEQLGQAAELADSFLALARKHPSDPVAIEALAWVLVHVRDGEKPAEAFRLLQTEHIASERLGGICAQLARKPSLEGEKLLRAALDKSPHRAVQAQACFQLAAHLQQQRKILEAMRAEPGSRRRFEQFYGRAFSRELARRDDAKLAQEVEQLYERVVQSYGDADGGLADEARGQLVELRHLSIGKPAMEIEGEDIGGTEFRLADYRGRVVVLTFWGHW